MANSRRVCVITCPQCEDKPRGHYDKICATCSKVFCANRYNPEACPFCMYLAEKDNHTQSSSCSDSEVLEASQPETTHYESSPAQQIVEEDEDYPRGGGRCVGEPSTSQAHTPQLEDSNNSRSTPHHSQLEDSDDSMHLVLEADSDMEASQPIANSPPPPQEQEQQQQVDVLLPPPQPEVLEKMNLILRELPIRSEQRTVSRHEASVVVDQWIAELYNKLEEFFAETEGSSLGIQSISGFYINSIAVQHPIRLGEYVPYPDKLRGKQLIFNPKGEQNICLIQCLAAYKCLAQGMTLHNIGRRSKSARWCLRFVRWPEDIEIPITYDNINKIESINKLSIFIYVLTREDNRYYISLARKGREHSAPKVPLLMLEDQHLVLIKDFNQYVRNMRSHSYEIPNNHIYCHSCLIHLSPDAMRDHEESCEVKQTLKFYPEGHKIKFKNYSRAYGPSHTAYYDFECLLDPSNPQGMIEKRHKAVAYAFIIINRELEVVDKLTYMGDDSVNHFIDTLEKAWKRIKSTMPKYKISMTREHWQAYRRQTTCEMCYSPFKSAMDKHRHHDHAIEFNNYLAAYCQRCNMLCRNSYKYMYTFSHNAAYDLGVILNELSNVPNREIDIASKDGFKFMKVDIGKLRFMDSLALLNGGLEKLAKEHIKEGKPTTYTSVMLDDVPAAAHHLLKTGKQVFCYDYISSLEKLNEPALPPPEAFFNSLKHEAISENDYTQAKEFFRLAECKTIGDYLKVYLKVDTGLLCDVFTVWRKTMLELYKNLRGGFTSVVRQHKSVQNEHTGADPSSTDKYILYLDFNGLYATCMTELLPQGGIRKLSAAECNDWLQQGLENITCDGDKGYWVMCDTKHVAPEVARYTDDLPLTLSHANISTDLLSDYSKHILNTEDRKLPKKNNKLIASHLPKKDYLVSLDLLQMLMKLGLEVAKVNAVYEFQQSKYLKEFVETNARERAITPCAIKGKAFKLVSNAIYGKSLTNILQIAKRILYDFWYNTVKAHYGDKAKLLYTDTDSYLIELSCPNAFEELNKLPLSQHMDFSNFPPENPYFDDSRKGQLGLLKSEVGAKIIKELIALKPKMYSILTQDQVQICRCKGIPTYQQSKLTHAAFQSALELNIGQRFQSRSIRNVKGRMCTCLTTKRGLSAFDDKRYVLSPTQSLAYGHPDIPQAEIHEEENEEEEDVPAPAAAAARPVRRGFHPIFNMWGKRDALVNKTYPHN
ncbi:uncharacterized protein [Procambarus clarkii]|uniref:uncharacterized protein n=1 Tax=Procambarus clarkii TaxID=6728 RepID=UPI0037443894